MAFDSPLYFLFLGLTSLGFHLVPFKWRAAYIALASLLFIGYMHWWFALCLLAVTLVSFLAAQRMMQSAEHNTWIYRFATSGLIITLIGFKIGSDQIDILLDYNPESILWPIGLSYYIFQAIGYLTEVKWRTQLPESNFENYLAYLSFFPKIPAGPIERAHHFFASWKRNLSWNDIAYGKGLQQILWGLFKKKVVADRIAPVLTDFHTNWHLYSGFELILFIALQTIWLYAEFSGYTDIALGSARLFGVELTDNFNQPFKAKSLSEFWRRWHITLSSWVADYVHMPLSLRLTSIFTNRSGVFISLLASFLLIGVWHGLNARFVWFGISQGLLIVFEYYTRLIRHRIINSNPKAMSVLGTLFTLIFFALSTAWFFIPSLSDFVDLLCQFFSNGQMYHEVLTQELVLTIILITAFFVLDHHTFTGGYHNWATRLHYFWQLLIAFGIALAIIVFAGVDQVPFLYERF